MFDTSIPAEGAGVRDGEARRRGVRDRDRSREARDRVDRVRQDRVAVGERRRAVDQLGAPAADANAERVEVRCSPAAGRRKITGGQGVLERPGRGNRGDREGPVVAGDADTRDDHDVADRATVRDVRLDRRGRARRGRTGNDVRDGAAAGDRQSHDRVLVLEGPSRRDGGDGEGAVVARLGDALDRGLVADLELVGRRRRDRDGSATLHRAAAGRGARHRVDGDAERGDRAHAGVSGA